MWQAVIDAEEPGEFVSNEVPVVLVSPEHVGPGRMALKPCLLPLLLKWLKITRPPGLMNKVWDASVVRVILKVKILTERLHRVAFFLPPSPDVQYSIGRKHRREGLQRSVVIVREVHKAKDSLQALGRLCGCSARVEQLSRTKCQGNLTTTEHSVKQRMVA